MARTRGVMELRQLTIAPFPATFTPWQRSPLDPTHHRTHLRASQRRHHSSMTSNG